ncbi:MAG: NADH:ubiquinone reductase (Na(+)-transporting) subunit E [Planctomycetes bacterium]|nr:NADH:ubiquinone reductase (Na(+)-transporting) subunit E [Planctomycetota bacterium]MCB9876274.1 NADH:ubiquinone reductase (Na(+)-transporting) subunit E [Planctomycetota bacterium]
MIAYEVVSNPSVTSLLDLVAFAPQEEVGNPQGLVSILLKSIFVENILLAFFLGMCSYLAVSKRVDSSLGLGIAVIFVLGLTVPLNWVIEAYVLRPGALAWAGMPDSDLSYLRFLTYIATIAAAVQIVEMAVDKFSPKLYAALGIFLPLIAVNCAILGSSLFMEQRKYDFVQSVVFGLGSGTGWMLAIVSMAAIRWKLRTAHIPAPLKGLGITFITTGLVAMAFMTFSGI